MIIIRRKQEGNVTWKSSYYVTIKKENTHYIYINIVNNVQHSRKTLQLFDSGQIIIVCTWSVTS